MRIRLRRRDGVIQRYRVRRSTCAFCGKEENSIYCCKYKSPHVVRGTKNKADSVLSVADFDRVEKELKRTGQIPEYATLVSFVPERKKKKKIWD